MGAAAETDIARYPRRWETFRYFNRHQSQLRLFQGATLLGGRHAAFQRLAMVERLACLADAAVATISPEPGKPSFGLGRSVHGNSFFTWSSIFKVAFADSSAQARSAGHCPSFAMSIRIADLPGPSNTMRFATSGI